MYALEEPSSSGHPTIEPARNESRQPEPTKHVLIGQTPRMRHIAQLTQKLGKTRWPALLLGETGTGKEVVARAIHSVKNEGPFVTIDCSALVGPLMESELFGHVKGSFTGAAVTKVGMIESANGGTAFFDEIGELPLDMQSKLLRVLQEKEFRPVGSLSQKRSDFRIIAATNRELAKEVDKGAFRRDLYFRLNVVTIRLTPLRERKEDIPLLVQHFLARYGMSYTLTAETMDALMSYEWGGNVRELENCIQHMVALNSGPLLHTEDLPSAILNHVRQEREPLRAMAASASGMPPLLSPPRSPTLPGSPKGYPSMPIPLVEVEKRVIMEALEYTKGDRAVAAQLLGIGRTTLYRKIRDYQLRGHFVFPCLRDP